MSLRSDRRNQSRSLEATLSVPIYRKRRSALSWVAARVARAARRPEKTLAFAPVKCRQNKATRQEQLQSRSGCPQSRREFHIRAMAQHLLSLNASRLGLRVRRGDPSALVVSAL